MTKTDQARLVAGWETLVNYDADFNISYEHGLAEEIETKAADLYVVRLKEGILFHGGQPVTADDVIYSFQRRLDPELGLAPALVELLDPSGLTKVDDRTVEIQLKQPAVTFINGLAEYTSTIVPTGYERFAGDAANQIGTGPYILQSFTPGAESVHTKNPDYWGEGMPYLDEVQIIDFADVPALVNALSSGEIDAAVDIPFAQVSAVEGDSNLQPARVGGRELAGDHDGRRPAAVRRRPGAPGDAPDRRTARRWSSACCPATAVWQRHVRRVRRRATRRTSPSASRTSRRRWRCSPRPARRASPSTSSRPTTRPVSPTSSPCSPTRRRPPASPSTPRSSTAPRTGATSTPSGRSPPASGARGRTSTRSPPGSLQASTYPETHWPPEGSDFEAKYREALAETDEAARCAIIEEMQREEYEEGGNIIPIFNNLIDATAANVQGFVAQPNVLNLDHFGRGFKNIWHRQTLSERRSERRGGSWWSRADERSRMGIVKFIVRRLLFGVLTLFIVSVAVFLLTQALSDPARAILGRDGDAGGGPSPCNSSSDSTGRSSRSTGTGSAGCSPATQARRSPTGSR